MANTRKTRNGVAGAAKKGNGLGQLFTGALISAAVNNIVTPGSFDKILSWLSGQHFSQKFINLVKQIHLPEGKDPMETVSRQCDAVEELIATKSSDLADDAPIGQWRRELEKIRRGIDLMNRAPSADRKKVKALQQRSKRLFDSAFKAAVE